MLNKIKSKLIKLCDDCRDKKEIEPFINGEDRFCYNRDGEVVDEVYEVFLILFNKLKLPDERVVELYNIWKRKVNAFSIVKTINEIDHIVIVDLDINENIIKFKTCISALDKDGVKTYITEKRYGIIAKFIEIELLKYLLDSRGEMIGKIYF